MIASKDRSDWFGASDTSTIMGNWKTDTFAKWWAQKIGINTSTFSNRYTSAGTYIEHRILEFVGADAMDRQILLPEYCLRINLDGERGDEILECKTYIYEKGYSPTKAHIQQVRVQMWGANMKGRIVAYGLLEADYDNYFRDIEENRLQEFVIEQDKDFICEYIKRITYLSDCLKRGIFPKELI